MFPVKTLPENPNHKLSNPIIEFLIKIKPLIF